LDVIWQIVEINESIPHAGFTLVDEGETRPRLIGPENVGVDGAHCLAKLSKVFLSVIEKPFDTGRRGKLG